MAIVSSSRLQPRPCVRHAPLSLDRFLLLKAWPEALCMACYSFSYGVVSTYVAIYGKEELKMTAGAGLFFALMCIGLMSSRLVGAKGLRQGRVAENAAHGVLVSLAGYMLFAAVHNVWGVCGAALIVGLGNGHMFPAFQTMFVNLAPNSARGTANGTLLTAWDVGYGLGIVLGGVAAELFHYEAAFWLAWAVNAVGVAFFFAYTYRHFLLNRIR